MLPFPFLWVVMVGIWLGTLEMLDEHLKAL